MAEAAPQAPPVVAPTGINNKMIFIVLGAMFFLLVAGMGGMFFMLKGKSGDKETTATESAEKDEKDNKKDKSKEKKEAKNKSAALYVSFEPPFVVNFTADSPVRFLQVSLQVMTRDAVMEHALKENDPAVRNGILALLATQKYEELSTAAGKETLRTKALEAVRAVIKEEGGDIDKVEAVYFTSFVMQ